MASRSSSLLSVGTHMLPPGMEVMTWGILPPSSAAISEERACIFKASR